MKRFITRQHASFPPKNRYSDSTLYSVTYIIAATHRPPLKRRISLQLVKLQKPFIYSAIKFIFFLQNNSF